MGRRVCPPTDLFSPVASSALHAGHVECRRRNRHSLLPTLPRPDEARPDFPQELPLARTSELPLHRLRGCRHAGARRIDPGVCPTNPLPHRPRKPIRLPPNARDVTAEHLGTVFGLVGATASAKAHQPHDRTPGAIQSGTLTLRIFRDSAVFDHGALLEISLRVHYRDGYRRETEREFQGPPKELPITPRR